jgi:hypothetical protein
LGIQFFLLAAFAAVAITFFSVFQVALPGPVISFRHQESWQSTETLRVIIPGAVAGQSMTTLSHFYAQLATSDEVRELAFRDGPLRGSYDAVATTVAPNEYLCTSPTLEVGCHERGTGDASIRIDGLARTRARAAQIAKRISRAFRTYVQQQQHAAQIPRASRIQFKLGSVRPNVEQVATRRLTGPLIALGTVSVLLLLAAFSKSRAARR